MVIGDLIAVERPIRYHWIFCIKETFNSFAPKMFNSFWEMHQSHYVQWESSLNLIREIARNGVSLLLKYGCIISNPSKNNTLVSEHWVVLHTGMNEFFH